jgi:hypothetical protein
VLDVAGWRQSVLRTANRFGLLVAGDLASALRALAGTPTLAREDLGKPDALDLIHFAFSDRYAAARREAGLTKD